MNQEKIGKFIASYRKEQGFTQTVLAEKLGITDRAKLNAKGTGGTPCSQRQDYFQMGNGAKPA